MFDSSASDFEVCEAIGYLIAGDEFLPLTVILYYVETHQVHART